MLDRKFINLQLFAGEEDDDFNEDENREDENDGEEQEGDENADEQEQDGADDEGADDDAGDDDGDESEESNENDEESETGEESNQSEEEVKPKTVPLKDHLKEREKYKKRLAEANDPEKNKYAELGKKVHSILGQGKSIEDMERDLEGIQVSNLSKIYENQGYTPEDANILARKDMEIQKKDRALRDTIRDAELVEVMKDPFYSDASAFKKEIYDLCEQSGGKLSVKQAYNALRGDLRIQEVLTDKEQKNLAKRQKVAKKTVENDGSSKQKDNYASKLTKDERIAAKALGWSFEKMYKNKTQEGID